MSKWKQLFCRNEETTLKRKKWKWRRSCRLIKLFFSLSLSPPCFFYYYSQPPDYLVLLNRTSLEQRYQTRSALKTKQTKKREFLFKSSEDAWVSRSAASWNVKRNNSVIVSRLWSSNLAAATQKEKQQFEVFITRFEALWGVGGLALTSVPDSGMKLLISTVCPGAGNWASLSFCMNG